ncbi:MAG: ornithine cyclodeaminase family protein [Bacillota bacterium]|jgi:ornithine cyclodeaminase/alanine dehydrogenase-like protein (mu-crystallin family)
MLLLDGETILNLVSLDEVMDWIEDAYRIYSKGSFSMPHRIHVDYKDKTVLYMPCFMGGVVFGTKILTVIPKNREIGKPVIDGLMQLNHYETGETLAVLDGRILTALRTGAVGGAAMRYTTPENMSTLGLIGAGTQGYYQVLYACRARNIKQVYVFDVDTRTLAGFRQRLSQALPHVDIIAASCSELLLRESEAIITATTSLEPVVPDDESLLEGKHFIGIGSYKPNMREFPDALFRLVEKVYIDTEIAREETGDLVHPLSTGLISESQIETFDTLIGNSGHRQPIGNGTTLFKSVGMALFDLVVSWRVYQKSLALSSGT